MKFKIGIVADNYKIPSFKAKLLKEGFRIIFDGQFTTVTTLLQVESDPEGIEKIAKICAELEIKFDQHKAKNN